MISVVAVDLTLICRQNEVAHAGSAHIVERRDHVFAVVVGASQNQRVHHGKLLRIVFIKEGAIEIIIQRCLADIKHSAEKTKDVSIFRQQKLGDVCGAFCMRAVIRPLSDRCIGCRLILKEIFKHLIIAFFAEMRLPIAVEVDIEEALEGVFFHKGGSLRFFGAGADHLAARFKIERIVINVEGVAQTVLRDSRLRSEPSNSSLSTSENQS